MVLVQKLPFFQLFFLGNIGQKKKRLSRLKKRGSKSRKIDIFKKGLTHGFGPKTTIFPTFFFRQYRPEKCVL